MKINFHKHTSGVIENVAAWKNPQTARRWMRLYMPKAERGRDFDTYKYMGVKLWGIMFYRGAMKGRSCGHLGFDEALAITQQSAPLSM